MASIKQLKAKYNVANPPPVKPSRMWKNKAAGIRTPAAESYQIKLNEHNRRMADFIEARIDEQVAAAGVLRLTPEERFGWLDSQEFGDDNE
jgi:hypothetical protein